MAVLWRRQVGADLYEVRTAGETRRLYSNGVFHSQYNPRHPVTGNVWDLLLLPAFLVPPGEVRRVLVLGVGGGAVIRQLRHFLRPERIVGVELNPVHLQVARRFFDVRGADVELVRADARRWLRDYRGPKFDLIIEDLFGEADGEPVRAIEADVQWMRSLCGALAKQGVLVMNFPSLRELRTAAALRTQVKSMHFPSVLRFSTPQNENAVGAFLPESPARGALPRRLRAWPELDTRRAACRLRYRMQRL